MDFGFGQRDAQAGDLVMRLGFVTDDQRLQVGVAVSQSPDGRLRCVVSGAADLEAVVAQTARILSVDVDATGWDALGRRDDLIGRLQAARPGLRPPLFHSAYEALCWAVISARRPAKQMAEVRRQLSERYGAVVPVAGTDVAVMPTPAQLVAITDFDALPEVKLRRLREVAAAALDGRLDTAALKALPQAEAETMLRELDGIGPFYAELVTVRALGHTDVVPSAEPTLLAEAGRLMRGGVPFTAAEYAEAARAWSPWRTWASVAIRAAGPRLQ
ncbi:DNA-3-methyladenine glycosylase [Acidothermaceae bacterium B102]|nr:DNA-3-methyladenine glycosylase [Acidothermaceae bacterium B102]